MPTTDKPTATASAPETIETQPWYDAADEAEVRAIVKAQGKRETINMLLSYQRKAAHAAKLAEALRKFCNAYQMESDHDLECAEAEASKALAAYESEVQS